MPVPDYQSLFELACDGMVVIDASLNVVQANRALAELIGASPAELVGRPIVGFIDPDDLKANPIRTAIVTRDGSTISMRRLRRTDGSLVETELSSTLLDGGWMLCVVRVTQRRPTDDVLRETEARFSAVAENLHAGLAVTDLENRAVYVNSYLCERTGYLREELIGRQLSSLFYTPEERDRDATRLQMRKAGLREVYEAPHRRKDGTTFLAEVSAAPLSDGEGRVIGTVGVVIDVSERYEWEHELADREQRYRLLFEVMPLPTWVYDVETFRFLAVNPAAVAHYGYTMEQFLGMTILDIRPKEDIERARLQVLARRRGYEAQDRGWGYRHRKADGTVINVEITSHAFDFDGRPARVVVAHDVTDQHRLRLREREVEAQLLQAQKMEAVGRLAGGVAHDFNNLLSVVLNAAAALEAELPAASELRDDVGDIRQAVERGAALTRQLLAFGRKEVHAPAQVDLHDVVTNVERLLARALGGGARLEVRRGAPSATALADPSQLEQVLVNLVINARDAMPHGGTVTITSGSVELAPADAESLGVAPGRYSSIEVADTGVGMDEATRAHAFEPFFTTKDPHRGTGLGLATVYGIARQSAGAVRLVSEPGVGTRVTVLLPAGADTGAASEARPRREDSATTGAVRRAGTVLLVEDEPVVRAQARRLLERCGFAVIEAADGREGERQFDAHRTALDAIVTDVVMPEMGGVEMVSRLRMRAPSVPVVFVSGFTAEDRDLPLDRRTVFVAKPYTMALLCGAIAAVMAG
jgi:two-component system, cell cycle sensor histidine kinase and response regulator CckA